MKQTTDTPTFGDVEDDDSDSPILPKPTMDGQGPMPGVFDSLTPAERLLSSAIDAVRERRASYGHPRDHFARTVGMINAAFSHKLREPFDVADWPLIMVLDKIARHTGDGAKTSDTPIDLAGYAATLAEVESGL